MDANHLSKYVASCCIASDLALVVLNLGVYLSLHYLHESISFEVGKRLRNVMLVVLTMVKTNPPLKIFDASSFLFQMLLGVLHALRLFLACYSPWWSRPLASS